ncbi:MAG: putative signal transducing protein [Candidatus Dadabacteria bacterium]
MNFTVIKVFNDDLEAQIVKGRLESQGISCWLRNEHQGALILDPLLTMVAGIKLVVPDEQAERALSILQNTDDN